MEQKKIGFSYNIHSSKEELNEKDKSLLLEAAKAVKFAYAPYSKFKVGVALRTVDDLVIMGSNQENGSFPIGQCAERVALYSLTHQHGRKHIEAIAIMVENEHESKPATPCGSCRQVLNEYRNYQEQPIRLILGNVNGSEIYEIHDVRDLLPFAFDGLFLGQ
jgi:cytidine deaminase